MMWFWKCRPALVLAALLAVLAPGAAWSQAPGAGEAAAFRLATSAFDLGFWPQAEQRFGEFARAYTNSVNYVPAVLFEAQAIFRQQRYDDVIRLLSAEQARSGGRAADQFAFWIAEAQMAGRNYTAAADGFARLLKDFPDSDRRLEAAYHEAEALSQLREWPRVIQVLHDPGAAFQAAARASPTNELATKGLLLLAQAQMGQKDYAAAKATLAGLADRAPGPEMEWNRQYLLGQAQVAGGELEPALQTSTNLLALAAKTGREADSVFFQAQILEHLDRLPEAVAAYQTLLDQDAPPDARRQAVWKTIDLLLRQDEVEAADKRLQEFQDASKDEGASDLVLLTRGELGLKRYHAAMESALTTNSTPAATAVTNLLAQATTNFEQIITVFTNSPFLGPAQLNLGWCLLAAGRIPESQAAFNQAAMDLPFSEDQAVARVKLADLEFQQTNYSAAISNYNQVIEQYGTVPSVKDGLFEQVLYQIVQAGLAQNDLASASIAMTHLLGWFPESPLLGPTTLLMSQGYTRADDAGHAREILAGFAARVPDSPLLPETGLAIARTYDSESNWPAAINLYQAWTETYTNDPALPRAEFALAWDEASAGRETNALAGFNDFVARFSTNDLAPLAQRWVAGYFWRQADWEKAEINFKLIIEKWPASPLRYEARMMAGRAAFSLGNFTDATNHFTILRDLPGCPPAYQLEATFAYGDTVMNTGGDSNKARAYAGARDVFADLAQRHPTSPIAALAWGRAGDCDLQLGGLDADAAQALANYGAATNAYQQVLNFTPPAGVTVRSAAEYGIALALEKMGRLKSGEARAQLLEPALAGYLSVVDGGSLRPGESQDPFWVNEAGLAAGRLAEELGRREAAAKLYQKLMDKLPTMSPTLQKKLANVSETPAASGH